MTNTVGTKVSFQAQFALPPMAFFGVDQAPNQRLVYPLYGHFPVVSSILIK